MTRLAAEGSSCVATLKQSIWLAATGAQWQPSLTKQTCKTKAEPWLKQQELSCIPRLLWTLPRVYWGCSPSSRWLHPSSRGQVDFTTHWCVLTCTSATSRTAITCRRWTQASSPWCCWKTVQKWAASNLDRTMKVCIFAALWFAVQAQCACLTHCLV